MCLLFPPLLCLSPPAAPRHLLSKLPQVSWRFPKFLWSLPSHPSGTSYSNIPCMSDCAQTLWCLSKLQMRPEHALISNALQDGPQTSLQLCIPLPMHPSEHPLFQTCVSHPWPTRTFSSSCVRSCSSLPGSTGQDVHINCSGPGTLHTEGSSLSPGGLCSLLGSYRQHNGGTSSPKCRSSPPHLALWPAAQPQEERYKGDAYLFTLLSWEKRSSALEKESRGSRFTREHLHV